MYKKLDDGVYILHESLGVRAVEGWNPENNEDVVGVLIIEDEHQIVVALEDSAENLTWSKKYDYDSINLPIIGLENTEFDFNGEYYCKNQNLDSPDFPAAYYCLNYKKGRRNWYLPSSGELWLIYRHLEEIQTALSIVGGQKFITTWVNGSIPCYWSSTENSATCACVLDLHAESLGDWRHKVTLRRKVRPVSNFNQLVKHGNNKCEKRVVRFN